jgi:hypothetical protein
MVQIIRKKKEMTHFSFPPKEGRAAEALTGRFGMGTVSMGAEGRW